ncbi:MAG: glycosyltransferase [Clostridia bacterium]|nr:glycosyltransferase [Clostridia bacterium]
MKVSVCIPMYNENRIIATTAKKLSDYLQKNFDDYEILFCDDGSTDGCGKTVADLNLPNIRVISFSSNHGKGFAVRKAILEAVGDIRLFLDADLAYGVDVIGKIVKAFEEQPNTDLVLGSRNLQKDGYDGYTFWRKLASKGYLRLLCRVGGLKISDSQCGCKAFSAKAAKSIFSRCEVDRFAFDFEAILWANKLEYKVTEIPVKVLYHGDSKVRVVRDSFRMIKDVHAMRKRIVKAQVERS